MCHLSLTPRTYWEVISDRQRTGPRESHPSEDLSELPPLRDPATRWFPNVMDYAVLKNTSPHNYALFMAARDLCDKTEAVTMADLAEPEVIDPEALRLIVNATLIARYGLAAFQIRARGAEYER